MAHWESIKLVSKSNDPFPSDPEKEAYQDNFVVRGGLSLSAWQAHRKLWSHIDFHTKSLYARRYPHRDFMRLLSELHCQLPGWRDDADQWALKKVQVLDRCESPKRHCCQATADVIKRLTGV